MSASAVTSNPETDKMDIESEAKSTVQVNISTLTGKSDKFDVNPSITVAELKEMYLARTGLPLMLQRYVYKGTMMQDGRTLESYDIANNPAITLVSSLRGDIGTWAPHPTSPLVDLLKGDRGFTDVHSSQVADMVTAIKRENKRDGPSNKEVRSAIHSSSPVLTAAQCEQLITFAEERLKEGEASPESSSVGLVLQTGTDSQILLNVRELASLVGDSATAEIQRLFAAPLDEIKLRRVTAPVSAEAEERLCINFHVDYSLKTLAIALNAREEYTGGSIVYASDDGHLDSPSRPIGCPLVHDASWVHGVTSLTKGTRYSIFFLNTPSPASAALLES